MGRTECLTCVDYKRAWVGYGNTIKSEMALSSECRQECAPKLLDTADIVRDAIFQQLCSDAVAAEPCSQQHASYENGKPDKVEEHGATHPWSQAWSNSGAADQ